MQKISIKFQVFCKHTDNLSNQKQIHASNAFKQAELSIATEKNCLKLNVYSLVSWFDAAFISGVNKIGVGSLALRPCAMSASISSTVLGTTVRFSAPLAVMVILSSILT